MTWCALVARCRGGRVEELKVQKTRDGAFLSEKCVANCHVTLVQPRLGVMRPRAWREGVALPVEAVRMDADVARMERSRLTLQGQSPFDYSSVALRRLSCNDYTPSVVRQQPQSC